MDKSGTDHFKYNFFLKEKVCKLFMTFLCQHFWQICRQLPHWIMFNSANCFWVAVLSNQHFKNRGGKNPHLHFLQSGKVSQQHDILLNVNEPKQQKENNLSSLQTQLQVWHSRAPWSELYTSAVLTQAGHSPKLCHHARFLFHIKQKKICCKTQSLEN